MNTKTIRIVAMAVAVISFLCILGGAYMWLTTPTSDITDVPGTHQVDTNYDVPSLIEDAISSVGTHRVDTVEIPSLIEDAVSSVVSGDIIDDLSNCSQDTIDFVYWMRTHGNVCIVVGGPCEYDCQPSDEADMGPEFDDPAILGAVKGMEESGLTCVRLGYNEYDCN